MPDSSSLPPPSAARFGWCCQFVPPDGDAALAKRMNPGTVTIATLSKLSPARAEEKLTEVLRRNLQALHLQLDEVARHPAYRRLLRVNSGLLPAYTHEIGRPLYRQPGVQALVQSGLEHAGRKAIEADIRIGLHPDQYCVLNSANPATLANSVAELEYHADILRMMGLAGGWHPRGSHVNIHGGGRGVRPVAHISVSREDLLADWPADSLPDYAALAARGLTTRDLRAHSQRMWNRAVNRLVAEHLSWADFEVEAKAKNLAVDDLEQDALRSGAVAAAGLP